MTKDPEDLGPAISSAGVKALLENGDGRVFAKVREKDGQKSWTVWTTGPGDHPRLLCNHRDFRPRVFNTIEGITTFLGDLGLDPVIVPQSESKNEI